VVQATQPQIGGAQAGGVRLSSASFPAMERGCLSRCPPGVR
jgi:hypothetical protein